MAGLGQQPPEVVGGLAGEVARIFLDRERQDGVQAPALFQRDGGADLVAEVRRILG